MSDTEHPLPLPPARSTRKTTLFLILFGILLAIGVAFAAFQFCPALTRLMVSAQDTTRMDDLERRLEALETETKVLDKSSSAQGGSDVASLRDEIDALKNKVTSSSDRQAIRETVASALAFIDLRTAANHGRGFASELAALRANADNDPGIVAQVVKLEPFAAKGTPTLAQLHEQLIVAEKAAPAPESNKPSFLEKAQTLLKPLISLHPLHDPRLASVEAALRAGNGAEAVQAFDALPEDMKAALASWRTKLEARVSLDETLRALSDYFMTATPEVTP